MHDSLSTCSVLCVVYEASISAKGAGQGTRTRNNIREREKSATVTATANSLEQYIAENVFGESEMSSSNSQNR